jgi:DNA-binding NarL/FixJ family response regulator
MKIGIYSTDYDMITYLQKQIPQRDLMIIESDDELLSLSESDHDVIFLVDYDSVATTANKLIQEDRLPANMVVLERQPTIATGKMLMGHGIKAYGNSRMLGLHLEQLIQTVEEGKVWMYPELMAAMVEQSNKKSLSIDTELLGRLTEKEQEVTLLVLEGLTNDAIGRRLEITTRTVKAHLSSVFQKLHVNDRLSLVLLLK